MINWDYGVTEVNGLFSDLWCDYEIGFICQNGRIFENSLDLKSSSVSNFYKTFQLLPDPRTTFYFLTQFLLDQQVKNYLEPEGEDSAWYDS